MKIEAVYCREVVVLVLLLIAKKKIDPHNTYDSSTLISLLGVDANSKCPHCGQGQGKILDILFGLYNALERKSVDELIALEVDMSNPGFVLALGYAFANNRPIRLEVHELVIDKKKKTCSIAIMLEPAPGHYTPVN